MTAPFSTMISALDSALLALLWQGVVVALLLWFALIVLRQASANARYLAGCIALGALALLPLATGWLAWESPAPATRYATIVWVVAIDSRSAPPADWLALARACMLPAWAGGVLLLSIRLLWGCAKISRLKRRGEAADAATLATVSQLTARLRVSRPVRVLISSIADGPSVVGWLRPVLLLPAATVLGLSPEQLEAVLAHELAHVRRYDYLVNMVQMLIETLFFYHPAVWWISRRIRLERELCCDDIAVGISGDAVGYARALVSLERMRVASPRVALGAALGAKDGPLLYRIERLLGVARREPAPSRLPGIVAICLGLACFTPAVNPVKAQTPLPPAPVPHAPTLSAPRTAIQSSSKQAKRPLMQVIETNTQPVPLTNATDVLVEVSIDQSGSVNDARVISGPLAQRREALIRALNQRYPAGSGPSTRYVTVPPGPPFVVTPAGTLIHPPMFTQPLDVQPVLTQSAAQERVAQASASIARLRALQADASEKGAAQLQEAIDRSLGGLAEAQAIADGKDPLAGAKLGYISITGGGATEEAVRQVLARLPFRTGDVLTNSEMQAAVDIIQQNYSGATAYFGIVRRSGEGAFVVRLPSSPPVR